MTFAPEVLAQGDATERTVGEVMDDIDKWKIPLLGIGTLLVLAILVAGGLLRPGGFEKAGLRDIGPLAWPVWLFAALIVLLAQSSAQGILIGTGALDKLGGEDGLTGEQAAIVVRLAGFAFGAIAGFGMLYILHKSAPEGGLRVSPVDLPLGLGCFILAYPLVQLAAIGAVALYKSFQDGQTTDPIAHGIRSLWRAPSRAGADSVVRGSPEPRIVSVTMSALKHMCMAMGTPTRRVRS